MRMRHESDPAPSPGAQGLTPAEQDLAELIAVEVARRLGRQEGSEKTRLLDAGEVSRILGCERSWVYQHQAELGVIRLGHGSKPRLRFERARIVEIASAPRVEPPRESRRAIPRRRRARPSTVPLLEIKGRR